MRVAEWFFDHESAKFPVAVSYEGNLVRRVANWVPFLLLLPALFTLLRKLAYPNERMLIAPSLVLYLLGSVLLGPGLTSNVLFKENWGRPRPISLQQFAGTAPFQPWLIGAALGATSRALAGAGSTLRSTGQHLHKRVACL